MAFGASTWSQSILVTPTSGTCDTNITIKGSGWIAYAPIGIFWDTEDQNHMICETKANSNGYFSVTLPSMKGATLGQHTIIVNHLDASPKRATSTFTVYATSVPDDRPLQDIEQRLDAIESKLDDIPSGTDQSSNATQILACYSGFAEWKPHNATCLQWISADKPVLFTVSLQVMDLSGDEKVSVDVGIPGSGIFFAAKTFTAVDGATQSGAYTVGGEAMGIYTGWLYDADSIRVIWTVIVQGSPDTHVSG